MLDCLATVVDPIYLVGDKNVRFDRSTESTACQFTDVLAAHGLANGVASSTHDRGGALDIVATRDDMPLPHVDVVDADLSDHHLLRKTVPFARPRPIYSTVPSRS